MWKISPAIIDWTWIGRFLSATPFDARSHLFHVTLYVISFHASNTVSHEKRLHMMWHEKDEMKRHNALLKGIFHHVQLLSNMASHERNARYIYIYIYVYIDIYHIHRIQLLSNMASRERIKYRLDVKEIISIYIYKTSNHKKDIQYEDIKSPERYSRHCIEYLSCDLIQNIVSFIGQNIVSFIGPFCKRDLSF